MHAVFELRDDTIIEYRDKLSFDVTNKNKYKRNMAHTIPWRIELRHNGVY